LCTGNQDHTLGRVAAFITRDVGMAKSAWLGIQAQGKRSKTERTVGQKSGPGRACGKQGPETWPEAPLKRRCGA